MNSKERLAVLETIDKRVGEGCHLGLACLGAGVSEAWYRRWKTRLESAVEHALCDFQRSGRPSRDPDDVALDSALETLERKIQTVEYSTKSIKENLEKVKRIIERL